jgi:hypothetical protein
MWVNFIKFNCGVKIHHKKTQLMPKNPFQNSENCAFFNSREQIRTIHYKHTSANEFRRE